MMLGERIRELRSKNGMSQKDLGDALGVWQTTISQIESGNNLPSVPLLRDMASFFGMETSELIDKVDLVTKEVA